jgi:anti-sigma-K factor RskA
LDIKEYIASGIIEAYVMGLASEEEVRILECVQKNNPEVRQAILEAQSTLEDFASQQAIAPPAELKSTIWAKISEQSEQETKPLALVQQEKGEEVASVPLYPPQNTVSPNKSFNWFAVAASILLVASVGLNFYLSNNQKATQEQLASLITQQKNNTIAYQNLKSRWDMANNPAVKTVPLLGVEKHPDMKAMVYMEEKSNQVYLTLENMPVAPENQQYQLWAIVDGKPVSLGVYNQEAKEEMQKMAVVNAAQAFAITLEKRGGSPTPTLENMYVMGKI